MIATQATTTTLTTTIDALKAALTIAARVGGQKSNIPVLGYALIGNGRMVSTDLETQVSIPMPNTDAPFLLPIKLTLDAIKGLKAGQVATLTHEHDTKPEIVRCPTSASTFPVDRRCRWTTSETYVVGYSSMPCPDCAGTGYVELPCNNHTVTLSVGTLQFKMPGLPVVDFPAVKPWNSTVQGTVLSAELWRGLIGKVLPAISKEDSKFTLSGALLETAGATNVRAVATDGHRLHLAVVGELPETSDAQTLVHADTLKLLLSILPKGKRSGDPVTFAAWTREGFEFGLCGFYDFASGINIVSRKVSGQFPNWRAVVQIGRNLDVTLQTTAMLDALKMLAPTADKASRTVTLSIARSTDSTLTLSTPAASVPVSGIVAHAAADDYKAGFNVDYLLSVFSQASEPHLVMSASDADSAHSFSCCATGNHTGSEQFIVMPMRLK